MLRLIKEVVVIGGNVGVPASIVVCRVQRGNSFLASSGILDILVEGRGIYVLAEHYCLASACER